MLEQKKTDTKEYMLDDSIYINSKTSRNSVVTETGSLVGWRRLTGSGHEGTF